MRLAEWSVLLTDYPDFGEMSPFKDWDPAEPTKSLSWYHAYNAVKHHREENFALANVINLVDSVAALHIMQAAQWGPDIYDRLYGNERSPFHLMTVPEFEIYDLYTPNLINKNSFNPIKYFDRISERTGS
jgi:hypothetical protein